MDSLSAGFFFLIVFIALSTAILNKKIASLSFSLQFSVVLALPSFQSILTIKKLNDKLINLRETDFDN